MQGGSLGDKGYRYKKEFLLKLPIPLKISDDNYNNNEKLIQERLQFSEEEIKFYFFFSEIINFINLLICYSPILYILRDWNPFKNILLNSFCSTL